MFYNALSTARLRLLTGNNNANIALTNAPFPLSAEENALWGSTFSVRATALDLLLLLIAMLASSVRFVSSLLAFALTLTMLCLVLFRS